MARELRKKRILDRLCLCLRRPPQRQPQASAAGAGILRRGRFASKTKSPSSPSAFSSNSNANDPLSFLVTPRQRRYRPLLVIAAIGVLSLGMTACFLLGGQILSSLTAPLLLCVFVSTLNLNASILSSEKNLGEE